MRHVTRGKHVAVILLAFAVAGCSAEPRPSRIQMAVHAKALRAGGVRTLQWPDAEPHGRWTADGDKQEASAWCDSNGDWSISATLINNSIMCHHYWFTYEFGHADGTDPAHFTAYFAASTKLVKLCGRESNATARGSGKAERAIRDNFDSINAARLTMLEGPGSVYLYGIAGQ